MTARKAQQKKKLCGDSLNRKVTKQIFILKTFLYYFVFLMCCLFKVILGSLARAVAFGRRVNLKDFRGCFVPKVVQKCNAGGEKLGPNQGFNLGTQLTDLLILFRLCSGTQFFQYFLL